MQQGHFQKRSKLTFTGCLCVTCLWLTSLPPLPLTFFPMEKAPFICLYELGLTSHPSEHSFYYRIWICCKSNKHHSQRKELHMSNSISKLNFQIRECIMKHSVKCTKSYVNVRFHDNQTTSSATKSGRHSYLLRKTTSPEPNISCVIMWIL